MIIGDTEHDIGCGRTASALSVAVCTGRYGRKELEPFEPDFLLDDLTDTEGVIGILTGESR